MEIYKVESGASLGEFIKQYKGLEIPENLKKAVELCDDDGSIDEYGSKARDFVERYSWDDITKSFKVILENAVLQSRGLC